jgi:uncharacterized membrane protein
MRLKEDLLQQHSLTKYQRIERLHVVGGLGSRWPMQLLAEMMELCPDDEEASCFFVFLFLQHLPAWLRVQLEADDQADIRQLATRVDRLFVLHGHKQAGTVAEGDTIQEKDDSAWRSERRPAGRIALRPAARDQAFTCKGTANRHSSWQGN